MDGRGGQEKVKGKIHYTLHTCMKTTMKLFMIYVHINKLYLS